MEPTAIGVKKYLKDFGLKLQRSATLRSAEV